MKLLNKLQNSWRNKNTRFVFLAAGCVVITAAVLLVSIQSAYAVRISLKRIVFDGSKRSEILTLINNTGQPQTYRLGWRKYRMDNGKTLRAIAEDETADDILWADDMVRYAPRRVTVPAGGSQQVRLLLRRPKDIQNAEYRSHLWIITEAQPDKFTSDTAGKQAIRLAVQPAISLPIFVRHGDLKVESSITDAKLTRTEKGLNMAFTLNRSGNRSIYGDFDFICKDQGQEIILWQVRGIAVYRESAFRSLDFDIPLSEKTAVSCNSVEAVYRADQNDVDFSGQTLAKATANL